LHHDLFALAADGALERYDLMTGQLTQVIAATHRTEGPADVRSLAVQPQEEYLITAGGDQLVKAWACNDMQQEAAGQPPDNQSFVGHPGPVHGEASIAG
jgi:hypothetical protein